jgi:fatty-acyl-CoA synthase
LLMTGRMELILLMYAAASIGAIIVPLNTYSKRIELQSFLKASRPEAMIMGSEGNHQHYPTLLEEIISECRLSNEDDSWIPRFIYVLDEETITSPSFKPYSEFRSLSQNVREQEFLLACQSISVSDPLILLYTSGTLGAPKGIFRTTASFLASGSGEGRQFKAVAPQAMDPLRQGQLPTQHAL